MKYDIIIMGASLGGVTAIQKLLKAIPAGSPPILVVQHLPAVSRVDIDLIYGAFFDGKVEEIIDKMPLEPGHVYFAPGGYHVLLEKDHTFCLTQDEPVFYSRPSIDVSFESAIHVYRDRICALLLTGANADGAAGITKIHHAGGYTIVQDPEDAEGPQMPRAALALHTPQFVGKLPEIGSHLQQLLRENE